MGTMGKTQAVVNPSSPASGDSIAAYLFDGAGNAITSTVDGGKIRLDVESADTMNTANLQQVVTVGTTAVALPTSPLANRKTLFVQNISAVNIAYIGSATVTNSGATRGIRLGPGGFITIDAGPLNLVYGVGSAAGTDLVVWEHS